MKKILPPLLLVIGITALLFALNQQGPFGELNLIGISNLAPLSSSKGAVKDVEKKSSQDQKLWVPILVYHHMGTAPRNLSKGDKSMFVEPEWFEKHLQYLQAHNFNTIHFSDIAAYFQDGTPLPDNPIMINFDDGWANMETVALPLLQKYGMTATAFIITNYPKEHGDKTFGYMSWDQIKVIRDSGIEIGSHSLTHPGLTTAKNAKTEIVRSKKVLEISLELL